MLFVPNSRQKRSRLDRLREANGRRLQKQTARSAQRLCSSASQGAIAGMAGACGSSQKTLDQGKEIAIPGARCKDGWE